MEIHMQTNTDTSVEKVDKRVVRTKKMIYEAYIELFMKQDYRKITVKELADTAGINRKTFYTYYEDIYALLEKLEQDTVKKITDIFHTYDLTSADFNCETLFAEIQESIRQDLDLYRRFQAFDLLDTLEIMLKKEVTQTFMKHYSQNFQISEDEYALYVEYFISGIISMYVRWLSFNTDIPLERISKMASSLVLFGLDPILKQL